MAMGSYIFGAPVRPYPRQPLRNGLAWNSMAVTPKTPNWNVTAVHIITYAYAAWPP
jgi:hypothetical protein